MMFSVYLLRYTFWIDLFFLSEIQFIFNFYAILNFDSCLFITYVCFHENSFQIYSVILTIPLSYSYFSSSIYLHMLSLTTFPQIDTTSGHSRVCCFCHLQLYLLFLSENSHFDINISFLEHLVFMLIFV